MTLPPDRWEAFERPLRRAARRLLRPRLSQLRQYPPRDLELDPVEAPAGDAAALPAIAIVTPSFNQGGFLKATVESVLGQRYPRLRYLVRDGRSTDATLSVLANLEGLAWISEPDKGQADAINKAFARIEGDIMGWINSDDVLLPGALAHVARAFAENPQIDIVYGDRIVIDERGREVGRWVLPAHDPQALLFSDYIPQETMFWRSSVWRAVGPLDISLDYAMDWDFALRAQRAGFRFRHLPRFLGGFRVHRAQKTTSGASALEQEMDRVRRKHLGRSPSQAEISRGVRRYLLRQILCDWRRRLGRPKA